MISLSGILIHLLAHWCSWVMDRLIDSFELTDICIRSHDGSDIAPQKTIWLDLHLSFLNRKMHAVLILHNLLSSLHFISHLTLLHLLTYHILSLSFPRLFFLLFSHSDFSQRSIADNHPTGSQIWGNQFSQHGSSRRLHHHSFRGWLCDLTLSVNLAHDDYVTKFNDVFLCAIYYLVSQTN